MRILIAPDKFKDTLDAAGAAAALAAGVHDALPDAEIVTCPLGDGGEGTGMLLAGALGAEEETARVMDPLGRPRPARWWLCPDQRTTIVELAEASGLALLDASERDALRTTSFGTGQLLRAADDAGCSHVLLCVGGSATVDGGAGCLQALGWELVDKTGTPLTQPMCGCLLSQVGAVRPAAEAGPLSIDILCDVDNRLLGPHGAALVFGPQKGASPAAVQELEQGMTHWASVLRRCCGGDVTRLSGGGAAGGLPAGLAAAMAARLLPGFAEVARRVGLRDQFGGCALCLTGEGCIDEQTVSGKVVAGVARLARELSVPTVAFAGAVRVRPGLTIEALAGGIGVERIVVVTPEGTPPAAALAATAANLRRAAHQTITAWLRGRSPGLGV